MSAALPRRSEHQGRDSAPFVPERFVRWDRIVSQLTDDDVRLAEQCLLGSLAVQVDPAIWDRAQEDALSCLRSLNLIADDADDAVSRIAPDQPPLFGGEAA